MKQGKLMKSMQVLSLGVALVLLISASSFAAIAFNVEAIEAEIAAAVVAGEEPAIAAKNAIAKAVKETVAANQDYPGGPEALNLAILDSLAGLQITGLDITDLLLAGNHALGITVDPALEAYETAGGNVPGAPGAQGRANARVHGGNPYGPGGKPNSGSPT